MRPQSIFHYTFRCVMFIGLYLLLRSNAFGQPTNDFVPKINIPTSPEAALLGKFGDIPIGYYTGTADVSIPLYTLKEGAVEIPITLRYHGSGIKVEDQATWVGLGWDLSPEGSIIQEVRGKIDDNDGPVTCTYADYPLFLQRFYELQDNGYLFLPQWGRSTAPNSCMITTITNPPPPYPWSNSYEDPYCLIDQFLRGVSQPDIYHYSFNGHTGKFYINPTTQQIVVIEKNDQVYFQKVSYNLIKATTLDGTVYSFGDIETASGGVVTEYTGKSYKISNIQLPTGKSVSFTYTDNMYTEQLFRQSAELIWFTGLPVSDDYAYTIHNKKTLSQITSTDAIVNFNLSARDDINVESTDNLKKLSSIDITSRLSNKKIKTIEFTHSYFPYNSTGVVYNSYISAHPDAFGKRLKLDAVKEIGYDDAGLPLTTKPPYQLEYDMSVTMPMKVSFAKDFWGYYNGEPNNKLLPDLEYFDYFFQPEYEVINYTLTYPYAGANRYTDNTKAGAYLLKKVNYPTGGYTEIEYEPNSFNNQFIPDKSKNVHKIYSVQDHSLGGTTTQLFKLSRAVTISFDNYIRNGIGNPNQVTPLTYDQMAGCYIRFSKVKTVNGNLVETVIKQWDLTEVLNTEFTANGGKHWQENRRVEFDPDPDPTFYYQIKVVFPDNLNNNLFLTSAGVTCQISYYDNTGVDITESKQCGMRIRSIKNYTETGNLATHKQINYYEGKLLNKFRPLSVYKASHLDNSYVTDGQSFEHIAFYKKITVSGNDFGTAGGNLIGYGKVEEIELANGISTNGKNAYYYLNTENKTQQGCPGIPNLHNGLISKKEVYDNLNIKKQETNYQYIPLLPFPAKFMGINIVKLSTGSKIPCGNYSSPVQGITTQYYSNPGQPYNTSEYGYSAYTINAEYNKPGTVTTIEYAGGGNALTKTETYTYNAEGSVKTVTTVNSKGENMVTKNFYPNDYMIDPYIDDYMDRKHITGTPVIVEQYKGTTLLSRQRTVYGLYSNVGTVLPQYIYSQKGNSPEELRVTMDACDDKGNPTQYTMQNDIPVSIVWNADKTLPIARIENATYASLLALPNGLNSDFRTSLPNARVTTYTYKPLVGVATMTDVNNKTSYYEYDAYGRLVVVKDQDGNIIKTYDYHYKQ